MFRVKLELGRAWAVIRVSVCVVAAVLCSFTGIVKGFGC